MSPRSSSISIQDSVLVIEPGRTEKNYYADLWRYRELFVILAWRDIAVRYKQTIIGAAWAVLRPFLTMVVFTVIFGRVAGLPSDGKAPYALLVFKLKGRGPCSPQHSSEASNSLVGNANLISKVYFPRLIVPAAACDGLCRVPHQLRHPTRAAGLLSLVPGWNMLFLPLFVVLALLVSLGPGLWITALNVKYRDFRYVIPFIVQFGLYISPVGFSSQVISEQWRLLYGLNPMVGVI